MKRLQSLLYTLLACSALFASNELLAREFDLHLTVQTWPNGLWSAETDVKVVQTINASDMSCYWTSTFGGHKDNTIKSSAYMLGYHYDRDISFVEYKLSGGTKIGDFLAEGFGIPFGDCSPVRLYLYDELEIIPNQLIMETESGFYEITIEEA